MNIMIVFALLAGLAALWLIYHLVVTLRATRHRGAFEFATAAPNERRPGIGDYKYCPRCQTSVPLWFMGSTAHTPYDLLPIGDFESAADEFHTGIFAIGERHIFGSGGDDSFCLRCMDGMPYPKPEQSEAEYLQAWEKQERPRVLPLPVEKRKSQ